MIILAKIAVAVVLIEALIRVTGCRGVDRGKALVCTAVILFVCCVTNVMAVEINFGAVLVDQDSKPMVVDDKPLTLGRAAMVGLVTNQPDEQMQPGEEKFRKGQLALKVYGGTTLDLSAEDVALIKKYIGKTFGPLVVFRAFPLLDGTKP